MFIIKYFCILKDFIEYLLYLCYTYLVITYNIIINSYYLFSPLMNEPKITIRLRKSFNVVIIFTQIINEYPETIYIV